MRQHPKRVRQLIACTLTLAALHGTSAAQDRRAKEGDEITVPHVWHILLKSRSKAESIAQDIVRQPADQQFARFQSWARKASMDPGSAASGGDLGDVYPGEMVPGFELAVLYAEPGRVTPPVQTEFGWHLAFVSASRRVQVSALCDSTLKASIQQAVEQGRTRDRDGLQIAELKPEHALLPMFVGPQLGKDWRGPMQNAEGQLVFIQATRHQVSDQIQILTRHTELDAARLQPSPAPMACVRSMQEGWAINCAQRLIGRSDYVEFEGRAGRGRKLADHHRALDKITFSPVNAGDAGIQLYNFACGVTLQDDPDAKHHLPLPDPRNALY
jgi:hypothetical protein